MAESFLLPVMKLGVSAATDTALMTETDEEVPASSLRGNNRGDKSEGNQIRTSEIP